MTVIQSLYFLFLALAGLRSDVLFKTELEIMLVLGLPRCFRFCDSSYFSIFPVMRVGVRVLFTRRKHLRSCNRKSCGLCVAMTHPCPLDGGQM